MSEPKTSPVTIDDVIAAAPDERPAAIRVFTGQIFDRLNARTAAGLCWDCDAPIAGRGNGLFYGDTHCAEHARTTEIEMIAADQDEDDDV